MDISAPHSAPTRSAGRMQRVHLTVHVITGSRVAPLWLSRTLSSDAALVDRATYETRLCALNRIVALIAVEVYSASAAMWSNGWDEPNNT